jgi:hypothetical protein
MQRIRPAIAADPRAFGRLGRERTTVSVPYRSELAADVRLFLMTFLAGFIFVSAYLA